MKNATLECCPERDGILVNGKKYTWKKVIEGAQKAGPSGYFRLGEARVYASHIKELTSGNVERLKVPVWPEQEDPFAYEQEADRLGAMLSAGETCADARDNSFLPGWMSRDNSITNVWRER